MLLCVRKSRTSGRTPQLDLIDRVNETKLPFAELLGIEFVSALPDRIVAEMTVREDLCTTPAVLHGGAIMAFADTLGAMGTLVNLPQGAGTTTVESKTNFVAPAPVGTRVIGETTPVHRGRRTMIWQTRVSSSEGRLVSLDHLNLLRTARDHEPISSGRAPCGPRSLRFARDDNLKSRAPRATRRSPERCSRGS